MTLHPGRRPFEKLQPRLETGLLMQRFLKRMTHAIVPHNANRICDSMCQLLLVFPIPCHMASVDHQALPLVGIASVDTRVFEEDEVPHSYKKSYGN